MITSTSLSRLGRALLFGSLIIATATSCGDETASQDGAEREDNNDNNDNNNPGTCGDGLCTSDESPQGCPQDCGDPASPVCGDGLCEGGESAESCSQDCEAPGPVCGDGECAPEESPESCPQDCEAPGPVCGDGECAPEESPESCPQDCEVTPECIEGRAQCLNERTLQRCEDELLVTESCEVGFLCVDEACVEVICAPGAVTGCASRTELQRCNETGTGTLEEPCPGDEFCDFAAGEFLCTNQICEPGLRRCRGLIGTEICNDEGTAFVAEEDCQDATQCDDGECKSLCEINSKVSSFLGCEYWSVDLDNITGGTNSAHAVIISNPSADLPAQITVTNGRGEPVNVAGWPTEVPPGELAIWPFENTAVNTNDNADLLNTSYIDGTMLGDQTFRFESSVPVTAHQFNPLVENNTFTNDASLLLPSNAIGTEYLIMSWKHRDAGVELHGNFTVIAINAEPTTVAITPTTTINAGVNKLTNDPIARINAGETREIVLQPGQVLNLETEGPAGADLTGTEVITDRPAIVFGGHECANIPLGFNACDHIEQQLYPVDAWGSRFIGTRFEPRNNPQQVEVWRVLAQQDNTTLTTTPSIPNLDGQTLNRGEFVEVETNVNFVLEASAPILPAQFITGTSYNNAGTGDPAMTLLVPIEQWRRDYIVLTPPAYNQGDYLNVTAPAGATVLLDGAPIPPEDFSPVSDGEFATARVEVEDGPHTLSSDQPFTVIAYGYDSAVSYAYPGGLNLETQR